MTDEQAPVIREDVRFVGDVGQLFEALAKAQAIFATIKADSTAIVEGKDGKKGYTFDYAGLDVVLAAVRPGLTAHGLAVCQMFSGNGEELLTILAHGPSGGRVEVKCVLPAWNRVQELGSSLTYLKRYQLLGLLGVAPTEDDDGNEASGNQATVKPRERATPPTTRPAPKDAPGPAQGAVTPETKARVWDLAKQAGFNSADLETFSKKNQCGALGGLSELNALRLVDELGKLQVQQ